jgi:hypothetical protein
MDPSYESDKTMKRRGKLHPQNKSFATEDIVTGEKSFAAVDLFSLFYIATFSPTLLILIFSLVLK